MLFVSSLPSRPPSDLTALQTTDPVIGIFLQYWKKGKCPSKCPGVCSGVKKLVQQWPRIKSKEGVLYRQMQTPEKYSSNYYFPNASRQRSSKAFTMIMAIKALNAPRVLFGRGVSGHSWREMLNSIAGSVLDVRWPKQPQKLAHFGVG